jgi:hypothetical protein
MFCSREGITRCLTFGKSKQKGEKGKKTPGEKNKLLKMFLQNFKWS